MAQNSAPGIKIESSPQRGLKRTPLYEAHRRRGARIVEFAGWLMPLQYESIIAEHKAVRERAGLFDISHMGEIELRGPQAGEFMQWLLTNDLAKVDVGRAQYNLMLREDGGALDDLVVYRRGEDRFFIVVNAANTEKDLQWMATHAPKGVSVDDVSLKTALLALQGPGAQTILQQLVDFDLDGLRYYWAREGKVAGLPAYIARTGYTGEDGFELFVDGERAPTLWETFLDAGQEENILPCGLGARDTLRLEACFALYGHEITEEISPLEAGLERFVALDKGEFIGSKALLLQKERGLKRRLAALKMEDPGIPRQGYPLLSDGREVGAVTSGTHSPTLGYPIALALASPDKTQVSSALQILIHGQPRRARVVETPFYKRKK